MEGFMYKFHPQIEKTLELVRQGTIGEVRSVHSSFTFQFARDGSNYRWFPAMGGGALYDVGCYTLSLARLVFGAEPSSASAAARVDPATGVDMTTAALLEFPGGRFAQCDSSFESHFQSRLLAVGTEGTLRLDRAFSAKDFDVAIEIVRGRGRPGPVGRRTCSPSWPSISPTPCSGKRRSAIPPPTPGQHARHRRLLRVHPDRGAVVIPTSVRNRRRP